MRPAEAKKTLNVRIIFYTKLINDLLEEVKMISTKGLIKDLIYGYSIFNGAKYFVENRWQNYMLKRF